MRKTQGREQFKNNALSFHSVQSQCESLYAIKSFIRGQFNATFKTILIMCNLFCY